MPLQTHDFIEVALKIGSDLPVPNLGNKDSLEEFWGKRNGYWSDDR